MVRWGPMSPGLTRHSDPNPRRGHTGPVWAQRCTDIHQTTCTHKKKDTWSRSDVGPRGQIRPSDCISKRGRANVEAVEEQIATTQNISMVEIDGWLNKARRRKELRGEAGAE